MESNHPIYRTWLSRDISSINVFISLSGCPKTISLRLTKKLSKASLGMITNTAEIYEDYNSYGIDDKDSTPNNKNSSEDDLSSASAIISISTGRIIKYSVIAILSLAIITIGVFIIKKEVIDKG